MSGFPAAGGGLAAIANATVLGTAGSITMANVNTWHEIAAATGGPGTGVYDLTLSAAAGDVLLVSASILSSVGAAATNFIDLQTLVSGATVNSVANAAAVSNNNLGISGLFLDGAVGNPVGGGLVLYTVVGGDLSAGKVTLRPMYQGGGGTIFATVIHPVQFSVVNLKH